MEIKQKITFSSNEKFIENVQDISFWQALCPDLSITQMSPLFQDSYHYLNQEQWTLCQKNLNYDGVFFLPGFFA